MTLELDVESEISKGRKASNSRIEEEESPWIVLGRIFFIFLVIFFYILVFYIGFLGHINLGNLVPLSHIAQAKTQAMKRLREKAWADAFEEKFGNSQEIKDDHPGLLELIRIKYLYKPQKKRTRIYQSHRHRLQSLNATTPLSLLVRKFLKNKTNGFFIEYRTYDGAKNFETYDFENNLKWEGVLIEPVYALAKAAFTLNRRTWFSDACVSTLPQPHKTIFTIPLDTKKIPVDTSNYSHTETIVHVQCVPLYSILLAANISSADYFLVDSFGNEFKILRIFPYDRLRIGVIAIRNWVNENYLKILKFLQSKGYISIDEISGYIVFVHQSLLLENG